MTTEALFLELYTLLRYTNLLFSCPTHPLICTFSALLSARRALIAQEVPFNLFLTLSGESRLASAALVEPFALLHTIQCSSPHNTKTSSNFSMPRLALLPLVRDTQCQMGRKAYQRRELSEALPPHPVMRMELLQYVQCRSLLMDRMTRQTCRFHEPFRSYKVRLARSLL